MTVRFTDKQEREMRDAFTLYDRDNTGKISVNDLGTVMRCCRQNPTDSEILALINDADPEGNGTVTFPAFKDVMAKNFKDLDAFETSFNDAFRVFDKDKNGMVSIADIRYALCTLGEKLNEEEVDEILTLVNVNADGNVAYKELSRLLIGGSDE